MPKIFSALILLIGIPLGLAGCNSEASQQAQAQRYLDAAMAKLQQANAGYVPQTQNPSGKSTGLLVYRQTAMDAAYDDLNKVMTLDNAPKQQAQALRLGAEIYASAALHAAGEAAAENAILAGRSTSLLGYLSALEGSAIRADALEPQTDESLAKLQKEIERQAARREQFTAEVTDLTRQLQAVARKAQQFTDLADQGNAQAQALREKAFISLGEQKYDLQDQASKLERQAAIQSAAAGQEQVIAADLAGRLKLAQAQLDTADRLWEQLTGQVKAIRADTARLADESAKARAQNTQAAQALGEEFDQIVSVHENAIQKRMTLAGDKIDKAVADLVKAVTLAGQSKDRAAAAENQRMTRLQLLAAYVDQAHIATIHAIYLSDLANTTGALASSAQRIVPQDADAYNARIDTLAEHLAALNEKADQAIQAGQDLARELAPEGSTAEDGPVQAIALKQWDRLKSYGQGRVIGPVIETP